MIKELARKQGVFDLAKDPLDIEVGTQTEF